MRKTQYVVYWYDGGDNGGVNILVLDTITEMLHESEKLRERARNGELIRFVTTCSDQADFVGEQGVSAPPTDYYWPKRRVEATGRPSKRKEET